MLNCAGGRSALEELENGTLESLNERIFCYFEGLKFKFDIFQCFITSYIITGHQPKPRPGRSLQMSRPNLYDVNWYSKYDIVCSLLDRYTSGHQLISNATVKRYYVDSFLNEANLTLIHTKATIKQ